MARIAVMGSGGLGGYFGALLTRGGSDVSFVARGAHLAAMRSHGLRVDPDVVHIDPVQVTDDPGDIGPVDVVLVCVKLWDTQDALAAMRPLIGPHTAVVSFQNGVSKEDQFAAEFGADRVIDGVAYVATTVSDPGVITRTGPLERLVFGELDGSISARVQGLLDACRQVASPPRSVRTSRRRSGRSSCSSSGSRPRRRRCVCRSVPSGLTGKPVHSCSR